MVYDWKMELYWRLPVFLQETALSIYARHLEKLYYGPTYEEWRQRFVCWHRWSRAEAEGWQNQRLQALVELAARRVPHYRHAWRDVDWKSVQSVCDLPVLPCLEKQSIRQHEQDFIVDGVDIASLWIEKTSGTTGTSLRIYWPKVYVAAVVGLDRGDGEECRTCGPGYSPGHDGRAPGCARQCQTASLLAL